MKLGRYLNISVVMEGVLKNDPKTINYHGGKGRISYLNIENISVSGMSACTETSNIFIFEGHQISSHPYLSLAGQP